MDPYLPYQQALSLLMPTFSQFLGDRKHKLKEPCNQSNNILILDAMMTMGVSLFIQRKIYGSPSVQVIYSWYWWGK